MDTSGIVDVLTSIGCSRIRVRDGYVGASCPFAEWKHEKGVDRHPSFFVKIEEMGSSCYHCFTCGTKGLLALMLKDLQALGRNISTDLITRISKEEQSSSPVTGMVTTNMYGPEFEKKLKQKEYTLWSEEEIAPYVGKTHQYVLDRGVSILTAKAFEIGYDSYRKRVVFPIRNRNKQLVGAMTRSIKDKSYLPLSPFKKSLFLYGEDKTIDVCGRIPDEVKMSGIPGSDGVIVVEGNFDVMRIFDFGRTCNIVGIMTSTMSKAQAATLRGIGRPVYLMTDWDIAGVRGREGSIELLFGQVPVFNVPGIVKCAKCLGKFSKVKKEAGFEVLVCKVCGELWPDISAKKDPGMLTKEEIIECLKNAEWVSSTD